MWLFRPPQLVAIALIVLGLLIPSLAAPPAGPAIRTMEDLQRIARYHREAQPLAKLGPEHRPYAGAFVAAASDEDVERIKRAIDAELAATAELKAQGFGAVAAAFGEKMPSPDLWLIALAGAIMFRSLAFVLPFGFAGGFLQQTGVDLRSITGTASELYLAAILAGLVAALACWAARLGFEAARRPRPPG
jgi:hypothetical protein